jgi:predicted anti-sigma-YlaC factor YlaD
METCHISLDLMRRFLDGAASREESMQLVRHLLRGCESCSALMKWIVEEYGYRELFREVPRHRRRCPKGAGRTGRMGE